MSPEQAAGEKTMDGRSDQYALGCVLYEMLAGQPPFTGRTAQAILARRLTDPVPPLRTVRESVPVHVEQAINRALSKAPADRFATARQFAEALAEPGRHAVRGSVPRARRRWAWIAAAVATARGAPGLSCWSGSDDRHQRGSIPASWRSSPSGSLAPIRVTTRCAKGWWISWR